MKSLILFLIALLPVITIAQTEEQEPQEETSVKINSTAINGVPDSLYNGFTVIVLVNDEKEMDKLQEKCSKVFDGNIKAVYQPDFDVADYPVEEYPVTVHLQYLMGTSSTEVDSRTGLPATGRTNTTARCLVVATDRYTDTRYYQNIMGTGGSKELFYFRTYFRTWNSKATSKRRPIFTY